MKAIVQKWGNSLAVRLPKSVAAEAGLASDSPVNLSLVAGKVVIEPILAPAYTLDALLAQITPDNQHGELTAGRPVGREAW